MSMARFATVMIACSEGISTTRNGLVCDGTTFVLEADDEVGVRQGVGHAL